MDSAREFVKDWIYPLDSPQQLGQHAGSLAEKLKTEVKKYNQETAF